MRKFLLLLLALGLVSACRSLSISNGTPRVLFVGNSLIHVGNVPAVFAAMSSANGHPVASDMIVEGGATLIQRLEDGSVAGALKARRYTTVVLQERGGDLIGAFGPESREQSTKAIHDLSALVKASGAKVVLLGSYQAAPEVSRALVKAESAAAVESGITYVEVSETLHELRIRLPDKQWFASDGMHPGPSLALLDAIVVHEALHGAPPRAVDLTVHAPIYGTNSGLTAALRHADASPPRSDTPQEISYTADEIEKIVSNMRARELPNSAPMQ